MALLELSRLYYGATLLADVTVIGSYQTLHPIKGRVEHPIYDVSRLVIGDNGSVPEKTKKTAGMVRVSFGGEVLSKTGRRFEYQDGRSALKEYTLLASERLALRSVSQKGLPPAFQFQWDRLLRGRMSPTIEQQVAYKKDDAGADGTTFTIVNPTAGNLLVLSHGYYWRGASLGNATATGAGGTTFTNRGQAGTANFENYQAILDRIATGAEGTTITVTNGGVSQESSGVFFELDGMTATPFVAISAGADGGTGTVTTVGTGNVDTTGTPDTWLIAAFGTEDVISGRSYSPTSFVEAATIQGTGDSDHGTSIALRTVASEDIYNCAMLWTTGCTACGIAAAYAIEPAGAPDQVTGLQVSAYSAEKFILTWSEPAGVPTGYRVEVSDNDADWTDYLSDTGNTATELYPGGFAPETTKYWRVSAINGTGTGTASTSAGATTPQRAGQEALALLDFGDPFTVTLPPYGTGSWIDADAQHLVGLPIDPLIAANQPPIASAGNDQAVAIGATVQLDGSGSTDPEGDPLTYAWTVQTAPVGSTSPINNPSLVNPTFNPDLPGVYTIKLVVNDGGSDSLPDTLTVTVNLSPVSHAGADQTVQVGTLAQLDGTASILATNYVWSVVSLPAGSLAVLSDASSPTPTFLVDIPGAYIFGLTVDDGASPPTESETDIVTVTASELAAIIPMYVAAYRPPTVPGHRRTAGVPASTIELWKYPKDLYDVAVDWEADDVLPAGATALGTLTVVVKNAGGTDVTGTLVASSGVDGLISWAQLQAGTAGQVYDVILTQAFNNGQSLDRYVKIQVRNPRDYVVHAPFKYPADKYPIPVEWAGRRPRGNPALSTLITKAYDASDVDETSTYVAGSFVAGTIGAGYLLGGTGGESRLLEFAQEFNNGRKFHEYAMLTVEVPPA